MQDKQRKRIKKPVSGKTVKVPMVMQMEALECGAACLAMILAYYDRWIPLEQVRYDCGVSRDGSNAVNIIKAARNYGLSARGYRTEPEVLRKKGSFPCILHWDYDHFVVCCGFRGKYVLLNDPERGIVRVTEEEFDESFTGICLTFEPAPDFETGGHRSSVLRFAADRMKGVGIAAAFVVATILLADVIDLIYPAFSRFFLDRILTGENRGLLLPFIAVIAGVGIIKVVNQAIQTIYSLKISGKMAVTGSSRYMWKVLRMPMEFFGQRMSGDIQMRQGTNESIAENLMETLTPLLLNAVMMIFYLVIMLRYSPLLTLIGISTIVINFFMGQIISAKRINLTRVQMRDEGKLYAATVSGIQMIETIKAGGAENGYFRKWAGLAASVNTQMVRYQKLNLYLGMIPELVAKAADYLVLVLGVWLCMRGSFTLGLVMAFQSFLELFMDPAMTLVSAGQTIQEMRTDMERIEDVMQYPEDPHLKETETADTTSEKLSGLIEIKNISFGYSRLAEPLIEDFSMTIRPGSRVAFVGASGSGKSTLAALISGLYRPWNGQILFDGKTIDQIDRGIFTGSVAVADQEIILFEDTVAANIRMWDETIEDFEVILAARDAQIHDDIVRREGGYQGKLLEGGRDLSGGQRQRLEIARVLAQDPTIILMDEATSALDARTEYELVKAVKERGITTIVIAHRLSTIRDCDEIVVLDHGKAVERGTHEELYRKGGFYTELITNE